MISSKKLKEISNKKVMDKSEERIYNYYVGGYGI